MAKITSKKITQAVILAGGAGTRLRPFTLNNPKPMIRVNKKPFLEHLILMLKEEGIKEILILTGYKGEKIRNYFKDGAQFNIKIKYSHLPFLDAQGEENQSGIRLKNAYPLLNKFFLLLYCDNYWPLNFTKLSQMFNRNKVDAQVVVYSNKDQTGRNNILVDLDGLVQAYDKQRLSPDLNGVDIGFFILSKKVLELLPEGNSKFEDVVLPDLIQKKKLAAHVTDHKYYSIGDLTRVKAAKKFLKEKKVVFLDRDGVINKKPKQADYVKNWNEFIFLKGAILAIKLLNDKGYKIYLISNQAGIARGVMTTQDLNLIHKNLKAELKKYGAKIDGIFYCPHGWNDNCDCRKPKPGLLYKASQKHYINLTKAVFIGDDKRDMEAGRTAGCKTILVRPSKSLLDIVESLI